MRSVFQGKAARHHPPKRCQPIRAGSVWPPTREWAAASGFPGLPHGTVTCDVVPRCEGTQNFDARFRWPSAPTPVNDHHHWPLTVKVWCQSIQPFPRSVFLGRSQRPALRPRARWQHARPPCSLLSTIDSAVAWLGIVVGYGPLVNNLSGGCAWFARPKAAQPLVCPPVPYGQPLRLAQLSSAAALAVVGCSRPPLACSDPWALLTQHAHKNRGLSARVFESQGGCWARHHTAL